MPQKMKNYVCYHQGSFIQYVFLAGEYHKAMKAELYKDAVSHDKLKKKYEKLIEYLNKGFTEAVITSFKEILHFFEGRHDELPRLCLKANYDDRGIKSASSKNKKIVALYRDTNVRYVSDCIVEENTGFTHVRDTGRYYFCQNIPNATRTGDYVNPRLDPKRCKLYQDPSLLKRIYQKSKKNPIDNNWMNCWESKTIAGVTIEPHCLDCYKSTLIIPLTLFNNKHDETFLKKFKMVDVDRAILGYLCWDHIDTNYFCLNSDVPLGYIFADILSLYLLVRIIFVAQSRTTNQVIEILKE